MPSAQETFLFHYIFISAFTKTSLNFYTFLMALLGYFYFADDREYTAGGNFCLTSNVSLHTNIATSDIMMSFWYYLFQSGSELKIHAKSSSGEEEMVLHIIGKAGKQNLKIRNEWKIWNS